MSRYSLWGCLLALGTLISSSACAYTPLNSTSTTSLGPTTLSYIGQNVPCHSAFTIAVSASGAATITSAVFTQGLGDSPFCPSISMNAAPWTIGSATLVSDITYSAPVSGISVTVPGLHVTCKQSLMDTVTMTLNNAAGIASFTGTLHNGMIPCGVSGTGLTTWVRAP